MDQLVLLVRIFIYAIATYRYSLLLHEEDGPFNMMDWLRAKAGISHEIVNEMNDQGKLEPKIYVNTDGSFFAELLNCPYCISGWLSGLSLIGLVKKWRIFEYAAMIGCVWGLVHIAFRKMNY